MTKKGIFCDQNKKNHDKKKYLKKSFVCHKKANKIEFLDKKLRQIFIYLFSFFRGGKKVFCDKEKKSFL